MDYLSAEDILQIHSIVVDETGGSHGVRNRHAILSLENSPKQTFANKELYPTLFSKAAVYAHNIIMDHPFIDGNKRTGMTCAAVFLEKNGYKISIREGGVEKFALEIVARRLDIKVISTWFKKHSSKL